MKLSVIIVNYNVRAFLEQCLFSLEAALAGMDSEVWVVDNASTDDGWKELKAVFPDVKWLENQTNEGFGRANNQALKNVCGEFVLFLNPDTLVPENALQTCIRFFEENEQAGAVGVKMLDGSGTFLPESKRGNPGLFTSVCKLLGLHHIFPSSKVFARYYMGHLPDHENNPVEVLAGAFMMVRKEVLDVTGGFDERFFMYGEDIDLSYRINQTKLPSKDILWQTWYVADAGIIHFKGESTNRGSLKYHVLFYKAMAQFVQKHYASGPASFFRIFIVCAIVMKASVSGIVKIFSGVIRFFSKTVNFLIHHKRAATEKNYIEFTSYKKAWVAGSKEDGERVGDILRQNDVLAEVFLLNGTFKEWEQTLRAGDMIVWCGHRDISLNSFMRFMASHKEFSYYFHYPRSKSIIGSSHKKRSGEVFLQKS
ncbi:MAG: glycosyltransferase family 2 protein [Chitinophagaceae bacterium]|nr:glycosyltransferase family 2 protein [Chitinophagaceae bacterium]